MTFKAMRLGTNRDKRALVSQRDIGRRGMCFMEKLE
jgi:hypothetical protein